MGRAAMKTCRVQTAVDAVQVACALERHRLATGALPDTLGSLTPRLLARVPTDVVGGKPLIYRPDAKGGYILYSVGWNGLDDGGTRAWARGTTPREDAQAGDWVWTMPQ
jgi:hypothetical protein